MPGRDTRYIEALESARTYAAITGSVAATVWQERREDDGTLTVITEATWERQ